MASLSLPQFIAKWQHYSGTERSGSQSHFIDLCHLLGQDTPSTDPTDPDYAFEKVVTKSTGARGFADVWMKGHFAWEYKAPGSDLNAAYDQLLRYKDGLDNPRLLVVCDFQRFQIRTNFNDTPTRTYAITLSDLADEEPKVGYPLKALDLLRAVFEDPERLRPDRTTAQVTKEAAADFARLADSLRRYGTEPEQAAHFLVRLLFCLFAQDVGLLPEHVFTELVRNTRHTVPAFTGQLGELFQKMASGGYFGTKRIPYFNGTLFDNAEVLGLSSDDVYLLLQACQRDWANVEPAIFGTLFEHALKYVKDKRAQLGAHYTSKEDIQLMVDPVLVEPLKREWAVVREKAEAAVACRDAAASREERESAQVEAEGLLKGFSEGLAEVRVLDPACGSGNFLYVALKQLLSLEKQALTFAAANSLQTWEPRVNPRQLRGIEKEPFAHELAQAVIWIGYLQWRRDNGYPVESEPVLQPLDNVMCMDAILTWDEAGHPAEPEWPDADVIIGNPPFLGGKILRNGLKDRYVDDLFTVYDGRVPRDADLVCYWFERARAMIETGRAKRAGLLATQGIRGGANRKVLERIKETGDIFWAQSDRDWFQEGVAVHVSMIGFDGGTERSRTLDGIAVQAINANLTGSIDLTQARRLRENIGISFQGPVKVGSFEIDASTACKMMGMSNPHGRPNAEVIRPWVNGLDITGRPRGMHIIDFDQRTIDEAAPYEAPFEHVRKYVKPVRDKNRDKQRRERWWLHGRAGSDLRQAMRPLQRCICTPRLTKHRLFVYLDSRTLPDCQVVAIARDDDYFFGVLHSKPHELWARRTGTQLREAESGFRYTSTTTFETFPFPWPPGKEPSGDPRVEAIAAAARDLVEKRDRWLNPEGATEAELKSLTLTNLYNQRPTWLAQAHERLDRAVLDGYTWPHDLSDEEILSRLLALNMARAVGQTGIG